VRLLREAPIARPKRQSARILSSFRLKAQSDLPTGIETMKLPKPTTGRGALLELLVIVALAIGFALPVQAFAVKPYQIPSASMEPTLDIGQRVLVNRVTYRFSDPDVGDIVVFSSAARRS
jgi:signal peptidase I